MKIRFLTDICDYACGDHPTFVYANKDDLGEVVDSNITNFVVINNLRPHIKFNVYKDEVAYSILNPEKYPPYDLEYIPKLTYKWKTNGGTHI